MLFRRSSIIAVLVCAMLVLAGCSEDNSDDAQAKVDRAKAELQDAQAQLDKTREKDRAGGPDDAAASDKNKPAATGASDTSEAHQATAQGAGQSGNQPVCNDCGTVRSITPVTRNASKGSGVGAVAGGVAGAVVGSQIGSGTGKTIAQIAGTLGGAMAGNEVEKRVRKQTYYQVEVAMDAGATRTVDVNTADSLGSGTRVQVQGNNLVLMQ